MMKINLPLFEKSIEISGATYLVLEDTESFSMLVKELYQYHEEGLVKLFDKQFKSLKPSEVLLVTDILGYDINSASVLKLIYKDLENQLNEVPEVKSKIYQLTTEISDIMSNELLSNELDLEKDEITFLELFKVLGIQVETKSDTIFEKTIEIIQIFKFLTNKKLLIFVNTGSYFKKDEIEELIEYISLQQLDILFIEPKKVEGIYQNVLDKDFYMQLEQ